ncbi:hypothetical protein Leryth_024542 [Lithospermum erythrorhizon]|nr:hypothetical protein Leryth_024542 [Lithospermum erythrorhizon]
MKSCTSLVYTIPPSISTCPIISTSQRLTLFHKPQQSFPPFLLSQFSFNYSPTNLRPISPLYATATEEVAETHESCSEFIEVGYVYSVHGLQGQVRIKSDTDFPELRFSQPGKRWLRQEVSGLEVVQEMELVEGIGHPGQKGWIVKFNGIDTVEEAQKLIGSTVLVVDEDRPVLEDDEFYTRDLVGLRVILKVSVSLVGYDFYTFLVPIFLGDALILFNMAYFLVPSSYTRWNFKIMFFRYFCQFNVIRHDL